MLDKFCKAKLPEIAALVERQKLGLMPRPQEGARPGFAAALRAVPESSPIPAIIAEYKRASPSCGDINLHVEPAEIAARYAAAGARAISVLTEEDYFKGSIEYLSLVAGAGLPLLRKDFIFHPLQIDATAATRASAVLIIVRMLDDPMLSELMYRCELHGLEAVVEVFDDQDLFRAQEAGAAIIQVNNRDLNTLVVNLDVSRSLIARKRAGELWITASGLSLHEDLEDLRGRGFDAALVGTALMRGGDPGAGLAALIKGNGRG